MIKLLSLSRPLKKSFVLRRNAGVSIAESLIVFPVLLMAGLGVLHLSLLAQAKTNLEYAALMAARIAASTPNFGLNTPSGNLVVNEIVKRMEASDPRNSEYLDYEDGLVRICIMRPNVSAFDDHGSDTLVPGSRAIPNDNLPFLSKAPGATSAISVQDANILHLRVAYLYDSNVPFLATWHSNNPAPGLFQVPGSATKVPEISDDGPISGSVHMGDYEQVKIGDAPGRDSSYTHEDYHTTWRYGRGSQGKWIEADAVVVMQTPALRNDTTERYIQGSSEFEPCPPW